MDLLTTMVVSGATAVGIFVILHFCGSKTETATKVVSENKIAVVNRSLEGKKPLPSVADTETTEGFLDPLYSWLQHYYSYFCERLQTGVTDVLPPATSFEGAAIYLPNALVYGTPLIFALGGVFYVYWTQPSCFFFVSQSGETGIFHRKGLQQSLFIEPSTIVGSPFQNVENLQPSEASAGLQLLLREEPNWGASFAIQFLRDQMVTKLADQSPRGVHAAYRVVIHIFKNEPYAPLRPEEKIQFFLQILDMDSYGGVRKEPINTLNGLMMQCCSAFNFQIKGDFKEPAFEFENCMKKHRAHIDFQRHCALVSKKWMKDFYWLEEKKAPPFRTHPKRHLRYIFHHNVERPIIKKWRLARDVAVYERKRYSLLAKYRSAMSLLNTLRGN